MIYYPENPRRLSRHSVFAVGLTVGITPAATVVLILSVIHPRQDSGPRIIDLGLVCYQAAQPTVMSPYLNVAGRSAPADFVCQGKAR